MSARGVRSSPCLGLCFPKDPAEEHRRWTRDALRIAVAGRKGTQWEGNTGRDPAGRRRLEPVENPVDLRLGNPANPLPTKSSNSQATGRKASVEIQPGRGVGQIPRFLSTESSRSPPESPARKRGPSGREAPVEVQSEGGGGQGEDPPSGNPAVVGNRGGGQSQQIPLQGIQKTLPHRVKQ